MYFKSAFIIVFWACFFGLGSTSCPCELDDYKILTCQKGSITDFPDDILNNCGEDLFTPSEILAIDMVEQPIKILKTGAIRAFPNLIQLAFPYCQISHIEQEAFDGDSQLTGLYLRGNQLTSLEGQALLDGLASLEVLDLSENNLVNIDVGLLDRLVYLDDINLSNNPDLDQYITKSWTFCHSQNYGNLHFRVCPLLFYFTHSSL